MKKFLHGLKCILPLILGFTLQFIVGMVFSFCISAQTAIQMQGVSMEELQTAVMTRYMEIMPTVLLASHLTTILAGAVWYFFVCGRKKPGNPVKGFSLTTIPVMLLCAIGIQYISSGFLMILSYIAPNALESYAHLMESAGLGSLTPISIITVVFLAPIGEELLFRGVTLTWLKRLTSKFWVANLIQAVLFGVFHGNIIQGLYAVLMGLCFGYVREKYNSMYAAILLHALVNFCGTVISPLLFHDTEPGLLLSIAIFAGAACLLAAGFALLKKDIKPIESLEKNISAATEA